jgi:mono/diheme cytochrome c family protein
MKRVFHTSTLVLALVLACSGLAYADAAADYKAKCASCHGADGKGETPAAKHMKGLKDLASPEAQGLSDAELTDIIAKGKKPMPGYEGKLKPEQIDELVKYIRAMKK